MKVLIIEDDPNLGEGLKEFLENHGIEVTWIGDDREIWDVGFVESYDVVVLDLMLRFSAGEDILKSIRDNGLEVPVLVLTAKASIEDKEVCFNLGADDYVTKPVNPKELLLRIRALCRRCLPESRVKIGSVEVDLDNMVVIKEGKKYTLSKRASELLSLLIRHRGKVVTNDMILNCIWQDKAVGSDIIRAYIKELRKVIPRDYIKTFRGVGYMLSDEI